MNPEHSDDHKDHIDAVEKIWDGRHEAGWQEGLNPSKYLRKFIKEHKEEIGENRKVLDIGCGYGRHLIPLAKEGFEVTGVDISEAALKKAQEYLDQEDLDAELVKGETADLKFDSNSFDLAVSWGSTQYNKWPKVVESFEEVNRVLKKDGYHVFHGISINDTDKPREQIKDEDEIGYTAKDLTGEKKGVTQHYFTAEELKMLAEKTGFEIIEDPTKRRWPRSNDPDRVQVRLRTVLRKVKDLAISKE